MTEQWGNYLPPGENQPAYGPADPALEDWIDDADLDDEPDVDEPDDTADEHPHHPTDDDTPDS